MPRADLGDKKQLKDVKGMLTLLTGKLAYKFCRVCGL